MPIAHYFDSAWEWHRDIQFLKWIWKPSYGTNLIMTLAGTNYTAGSAGSGNGNDTGGGAGDMIPDANRLILVCDAPGFGFTVAVPPELMPAGTVVAYKLYAREWFTWNATRSSDILRWTSVVTLVRMNDMSWQRKGPNYITLTPAGDAEVPAFTALEAKQISEAP